MGCWNRSRNFFGHFWAVYFFFFFFFFFFVFFAAPLCPRSLKSKERKFLQNGFRWKPFVRSLLGCPWKTRWNPLDLAGTRWNPLEPVGTRWRNVRAQKNPVKLGKKRNIQLNPVKTTSLIENPLEPVGTRWRNVRAQKNPVKLGKKTHPIESG